jgi:hypothetical protein
MHQVSAIVHCDFGHTKSGGENVHTAKRNVPQDEALKPAEMVDFIHTANTAKRNVTQDEAVKPAEVVDFVHTANTKKRNVTQDEAMKPTEMVDFVHIADTAKRNKTQDEALKPSEMIDFAGYYHDASQRLAAVVDDHEARYHALQLQTIMDEMGQLNNTERMIMIQNMMHLNQVPPMVLANMVYSDKYQSTDNHPGQSFYLMERPISNVILTGTPIEEKVERIMTHDDKNLLPMRKTAKIGPKWSNKWLRDLSMDEYRRLVRQTKCEHYKILCLYVCGTVVPGTQTDRINPFTDYEEQLKLACKEYEEKLEMGHKIYADDEEENPGEMIMEATVLPKQQGDKIQPYCGMDPNDCLRFCNKLVQSITMDFSANNILTRQLTPKLQQLENNPANKLMAERNFLMNKVHSIQSQLESLKRDSHSVSGVNTCFYYVTRVHDTLPDLGTQLWGDRRLVNGEFLCK